MYTSGVVAVLRWPEEADDVEQLKAVGAPRLLLVAPDAPPPSSADCDEDWIRTPALDEDILAKVDALAARSRNHIHAPVVNGDGRLIFRGQWVPVSRDDEAIAVLFVQQFRELVPFDALLTAGRPAASPRTEGALRARLHKLRYRIKPLGLVISPVHGRGYVMEPTPEQRSRE